MSKHTPTKLPPQPARLCEVGLYVSEEVMGTHWAVRRYDTSEIIGRTDRHDFALALMTRDGFVAAAYEAAAERDRLRALLDKAEKELAHCATLPGGAGADNLLLEIREALVDTSPASAREAAPAKTDREVIETAADLAFGHIQEHLGVTDGGTAAMFWSGEEEEQFHAQMRRYIAFERALGEHSDKAGG